MRSKATIAAGAALAAALAAGAPDQAPAAERAAASAAPKVRLFVVGRTQTLLAPRVVSAGAATVKASGRSCLVGQATPLAALAGGRRAGGPAFAVRDHGRCSATSPQDSGSLFVYRVGSDTGRGRDGWAYKVGTRAGTAGAADPDGPFGSGRVRSGQRVTWFWCRLARGGCQRTLAVQAVARSGRRVTFEVRGYDDYGRSLRVSGAAVSAAGRRARTGSSGRATLTLPRGSHSVSAQRSGMVRSWPERVTVR